MTAKRLRSKVCPKGDAPRRQRVPQVRRVHGAIISLSILLLWFLTPLAAQSSSVSSALEFLELLGFSESELAHTCDDPDLDPYDASQCVDMQTLLSHINRLPRWRAFQWRKRDFEWQLPDEENQLRGELLRITGRLRSITTIKALADTSSKLGFDRYFALSIEDPQTQFEFTVVSSVLPATLEKASRTSSTSTYECDERVVATGLFVRANWLDKTATLLTSEIQWFPDASSPLVVSADHAYLAGLGVDIGQLDHLVDRRPLEANERECFYQVLLAMGRRPENAPRASVSGAIDLLQSPTKHRGRLYTVTGTARRAIRVAVDDPDIVERLGITHYYEIEVFDARARVEVQRPGNNQNAVFNSYPLVFCTRTIPDWMPTGDVVHQDVTMTGVYLKLWSYRSGFLSKSQRRNNEREQLQISPLLIAKSPDRAPATATSNPTADLAVGIGFGVILALLSLFVWRSNRGDRRFRERTLRRFEQDPEFLGADEPADAAAAAADGTSDH